MSQNFPTSHPEYDGENLLRELLTTRGQAYELNAEAHPLRSELRNLIY